MPPACVHILLRSGSFAFSCGVAGRYAERSEEWRPLTITLNSQLSILNSVEGNTPSFFYKHLMSSTSRTGANLFDYAEQRKEAKPIM
jgi:hypothetical protein